MPTPLRTSESAVHEVERRPRRDPRAQRREILAFSSTVRVVVVSTPAPRCDHRKHEAPALAEQFLINARIVLAHRVGHMGEVELDRPAAARLEVDEQRPVRSCRARSMDAARRAAAARRRPDRRSLASGFAACWREAPGRRPERRSDVAARDHALRLRDSIREVRSSRSTSRMPACRRSSAYAYVGRRNLSGTGS